MYKHEDFLGHYHKKSNVETTFHIIKSKFSGAVRSKKQITQINEILIKIFSHNICIVIQEINKLGIKAKFSLEQAREISCLKSMG